MVELMGLDRLAATDRGPFDLVLLLNNIYYWPPEDRIQTLATVRTLAPHGTVVVSTAIMGNQPFNCHLDVVLRVTKGSWRLPTEDELAEDCGTPDSATWTLLEPAPPACSSPSRPDCSNTLFVARPMLQPHESRRRCRDRDPRSW